MRNVKILTFHGFLAVIILLMSIICSCTRTVYQDREVVKHDSLYITSASVDTLVQKDSVMVRESGDTVFKTVYKYIYKVKERVDTCYKVRVDTVLKKEKVVETKIVRKTDWTKCVWAFLIGAVAAIVVIVVRFFKR